MKRLAMLAFLPAFLMACGGPADEGGQQAAEAPRSGIQLDVTPPAALEVPERKEVSSDTDWEAKAHDENIEVIQVINIINPVAAYIVEDFEQYGDRFSEHAPGRTGPTPGAAHHGHGAARFLHASGWPRVPTTSKLFLALEVSAGPGKTGVAGDGPRAWSTRS